eukprot:m.82462 g.82462  ORF g.82462 m.82462 type:complete len:64 (+) comp25518_c0_seq2:1419-1610(+)
MSESNEKPTPEFCTAVLSNTNASFTNGVFGGKGTVIIAAEVASTMVDANTGEPSSIQYLLVPG